VSHLVLVLVLVVVVVLVLEKACSSQHFELPTDRIFATKPRSFTIVPPLHRRPFEDEDEHD
jgi:hypothetical protein